MKPKIFLIYFLLVVLTAVLQLQFKSLYGWTPDFVLVGLLAVSFFAGLLELVSFVLLAIWLLGWRTFSAAELLSLIALPLICFWLEKTLPYKPYINNLVFVFFSAVTFYFLSSRFLFLENAAIFAEIAAADAAIGALLFYILKSVR